MPLHMKYWDVKLEVLCEGQSPDSMTFTVDEDNVDTIKRVMNNCTDEYLSFEDKDGDWACVKREMIRSIKIKEE